MRHPLTRSPASQPPHAIEPTPRGLSHSRSLSLALSLARALSRSLSLSLAISVSLAHSPLCTLYPTPLPHTSLPPEFTVSLAPRTSEEAIVGAEREEAKKQKTLVAPLPTSHHMFSREEMFSRFHESSREEMCKGHIDQVMRHTSDFPPSELL